VIEHTVPKFQAHPWIENGHLQTIVGRYFFGPKFRFPSTYHEVLLKDMDRIAVLESIPEGWRTGGPTAILVHGLGGCARAPYVVRVSGRLQAMGIRVVRMNLRGAGLGFGLAKGTYHAGRTEDLRCVVDWSTRRAPGSPVALVGFSLGGNLVLKLASEASSEPLAGLDCVIAANPPINLAASCRRIQAPENRIYDKTFVRQLCLQVARLHRAFPELGPVVLPKELTVLDFDDRYTAPRNGFDSAADYYSKCSSMNLILRIAIPGLVIHAENDPFIPVEEFRGVSFPEQLALELIPGGGHLGYLSRKPWNGDHRWLDSRIATWLSARWSSRTNDFGRARVQDV
jgi:uncharacterized protein